MCFAVCRSAGPEGEGGGFDSPSLPPLDSLPSRSDQGGALDPKAEGRSGRLAEKALYCASEVLRIAFSGRHPPCAPIGMRALRARLPNVPNEITIYTYTTKTTKRLFSGRFVFFVGFVAFVAFVIPLGGRGIVISLISLKSCFSGGTVKPLKSLIPLLPLGVQGAENCAFPFQKLRSKGRAGPYGRPVVGWGRKKPSPSAAPGGCPLRHSPLARPVPPPPQGEARARPWVSARRW